MKNRAKIIHWLPRILCILSILFVSVFALDAFDQNESFMVQLGDFAMHLIPSILLSIILWLAWNKPLIGGILFGLVGLIFTPWVYHNNYEMNHSVSMSLGVIFLITIPFVFIGVLFIIDHLVSRKNKKNKVSDPQI